MLEMGMNVKGIKNTWEGRKVIAEGTIIDMTANQKRIWVETSVDTYVFDITEGDEVIMVEDKKVKVKGSFDKWSSVNNEGTDREEKDRALSFTLEVIGNESEKTADEIIRVMENELSDYNFEFCRCPEYEQDSYVDTMYISFEYGRMTEYKKAVNKAYKIAKKMVLSGK